MLTHTLTTSNFIIAQSLCLYVKSLFSEMDRINGNGESCLNESREETSSFKGISEF
ncbi:gp51 [Bacillus phage TP21-L]|uniref:Gp51 n=1 Tax=Bacillus phage TP21-L TaxID=565140 RepID=B8R860_9CAUD|nr:gp51 [Bacillus phage TP21-L]ACJ70577.1 gp51 [Bacillus phage TP21-L]